MQVFWEGEFRPYRPFSFWPLASLTDHFLTDLTIQQRSSFFEHFSMPHHQLTDKLKYFAFWRCSIWSTYQQCVIDTNCVCSGIIFFNQWIFVDYHIFREFSIKLRPCWKKTCVTERCWVAIKEKRRYESILRNYNDSVKYLLHPLQVSVKKNIPQLLENKTLHPGGDIQFFQYYSRV